MYDIIIIGGSYAGLSAAMALGRSLKQTLVIDSGQPCNRQTPRSHNFLTQDGQTPAEISRIARAQIKTYSTITFHQGEALKASPTGQGFEVATASGEIFASKKLLIATGIKDELPEIPGFAACWGITVIHCPYCHGYEHRYQKTGILANGAHAYHLASLVHNLTDDLIILTNDPHNFNTEQHKKLTQQGILLNETTVVEVIHNSGHLSHVCLSDGRMIELEALYASVPFRQTTDIPQSLGCEFTKQGHIAVDKFQKTTVPGVYACGDNASGMRSIAFAVAAGNLAGAMANMDLSHESF